ncbi:MAG: Crp/Fnr family transcriptional regulator [Ileibacterium sp.]|nr:Crp/Fnr family transcriptional regulator [Ileibacterium sp.]
MKTIPYANLPLFERIDQNHLQMLLTRLSSFEKTFSKGDIIHLEKDKTQYAGIVISGQVQMVKTDIWGDESLMAYMEPGELILESFAVRKDSTSFVSFIASKKSRILFLSLDHIIHRCPHQCDFHNQLVENLFELIAEKNLHLMEKIDVTSRPTLREKILAYLSLEAQKQKSRYIEIPLNRQDMAQYLCANRSAMTRELSKMKEEGIIDYDGNTFVLQNEDRTNRPKL